jgi:cation diffusion facilitator family transporter
MAGNRSDSLKQINRITIIGAVVNLFLASVKIVVGKMVGSIGLVADGVHSVSDLATDAVVMVGAMLGDRPPDESHPYGHGKIATLSAIIVALILAAIGARIAYDAGMQIFLRSVPSYSPAIVVVAAISVVAKELLFQATKVVARAVRNPALLANAWHHRSDALSSIAVLFGGVAGLLGFSHGDQIAGVVVGIMVFGVGIKIGISGLNDLLESSVEGETVNLICEVLQSDSEVRSWHKLRTRRVGNEIFLDVHLLVDPDLSVVESHEVASRIERMVSESLTDPVNITIHIEPDTPENRIEDQSYCNGAKPAESAEG